MEGKRQRRSRALGRVHEGSRLEDELWTLVYAQVLPWSVAPKKAKSKSLPRRRDHVATAAAGFARGA